MADTSSAPKPSSSVKLVLLGEAAVGKVGCAHLSLILNSPMSLGATPHLDVFDGDSYGAQAVSRLRLRYLILTLIEEMELFKTHLH
jgi:hypothetical protein